MSNANNNFQDLKKLLKLKRHEIPPPGYFNGFSDNVVSRIRGGEAGGYGSFFERLQDDSPLLANFLAVFHAKPGIVGALATCACLMVLFTVAITDRSESASPEMPSGLASVQSSDSSAGASPTMVSTTATPLAAPIGGGITVSSNPIVSLQPVATLFGAQQNPLFQNVNFAPPSQ